MRFAVSNIALPPFDHLEELRRLAALGLAGIEVAPSRVWRDTWRGLTPGAVESYRREVEAAGLVVVGLHSLFFDHKELGLFRDQATERRTLDYLEHLSRVCRDLGGRTLIYGGGRWRNGLPLPQAVARAVEFFAELFRRIEDHGTVFCFEPLEPWHTDFIHSARDSLDIVKTMNHPQLRVQLDARALVVSGEVDRDTFHRVADHLVHFHANEPDLDVIGRSGQIDHARMGRWLREIGYEGYVSIEQRMVDEDDALRAVAEGARVLKRCYGPAEAREDAPT